MDPKMVTSHADILDVTIRDGSYLIDFQFSTEDVAVISSALESAGIRWIELGHGLGLNASNAGKGEAAATDEEYLEAAAGSLKTAKWGMFFIPGIGRMEDLTLARQYGMHFVRVGTNITEIENAYPFIAHAKELGFLVSSNLMKSYAVSPAEFAACAAKIQKAGADIVSLVDSAGGMFPEDISAYLRAAKNECDVKLGFHGHDNLSMAMANTLRAIEEGAFLVDTSLQGMGRSGGNAITEVLVAILERKGRSLGIELKSLMDIGYEVIQPLLRHHGEDPLGIVAGYAQFHSSFAPKLSSYAERYGIDVRDLIVRLCREDLVSAPDDLLDRISKELVFSKVHRNLQIALHRRRSLPDDKTAALRTFLKMIRSMARKHNRLSVCNVLIGEGMDKDVRISPNMYSSEAFVIGSITAGSVKSVRDVLGEIDGKADIVFLDADGCAEGVEGMRDRLGKSMLLTYSDSRVWVDSVGQQVSTLFGQALYGRKIAIGGAHPKTYMLARHLLSRGASVVLLDNTTRESVAESPRGLSMIRISDEEDLGGPLGRADAFVAWHDASPWIDEEICGKLSAAKFVIDAGIGSIREGGLKALIGKGTAIYRVNIWPALASSLAMSYTSHIVISRDAGSGEIAGVPVVAGGVMGRKGDVIIDSMSTPTRIIGIADGRGGVLFEYGDEDQQRVSAVYREIKERQIMK